MGFKARPESLVGVMAPDATEKFLRPFGSMIFRARLVGVAFRSHSLARQEDWGSQTENSNKWRAARRDELFKQGRQKLVEKTLNSGIGSESFMARLRSEARKLDEEAYVAPATGDLPPTPAGFKVPKYPDFSEDALFDD